MTETTQILPAPDTVAAYVAAVRHQLADLDPEQVDELVGGLEADLGERAAELPAGTKLTTAFGSPGEYADELRAAGGLPVRTVQDQPSGWRIMADRWRAVGSSLTTRHTWINDLRVPWWLLRGFVCGYLLLGAAAWVLFGPISRKYGVAFGVVGAVLSFVVMQRRRTRESSPKGTARSFGAIATVVTILAVLPVAAHLFTVPKVVYDTSESPASGGLDFAGTAIQNLYVYDAEGRRVPDARILDQTGRPLEITATDWFYNLPTGQMPVDGLGSEISFPHNQFPLRWDQWTGWERFPDTAWTPPQTLTPLTPIAASEGPTSSATPTEATTTSAPRPPTSATTSPSSTSTR